MIAKGLDFPNVTLVGIVHADTALHLPDFRAAERTFQLIAQVAGRTGRGPQGGRVVVQTELPGHYAVASAARHDCDGFARRELAHRKALAYPPYSYLARIIFRGKDAAAVLARAREAAEALARGSAAREGKVALLGPAPCPIARLQDEHRAHLVLKAASREELAAVLDAAEEELAPGGKVRAAVDVDPATML
jgi:primosomal protein N' (replication factor Y)